MFSVDVDVSVQMFLLDFISGQTISLYPNKFALIRLIHLVCAWRIWTFIKHFIRDKSLLLFLSLCAVHTEWEREFLDLKIMCLLIVLFNFDWSYEGVDIIYYISTRILYLIRSYMRGTVFVCGFVCMRMLLFSIEKHDRLHQIQQTTTEKTGEY